MLLTWDKRSIISANLLNPAFCGEVIRRSILGYNSNNENEKIPFLLIYLVLPIVLHKETREKMPLRSNTYFHSWVDSQEYLFIDFAERVRQITPYTKESLMFLLNNKAIEIDQNGTLSIIEPYRKRNPKGELTEEVLQIYKKAELLGKWFKLTGNPQTIYMFLKIKP
jgi:hypothetical protein